MASNLAELAVAGTASGSRKRAAPLPAHDNTDTNLFKRVRTNEPLALSGGQGSYATSLPPSPYDEDGDDLLSPMPGNAVQIDPVLMEETQTSLLSRLGDASALSDLQFRSVVMRQVHIDAVDS